MKRCNFVLCLLLIIAVAGCSNVALQPVSHSNASQQLLAQAEVAQQSGDISGAISHVERAVRIEPRNAYAWHTLATLQLAAGNINKAEQFARRSNQYAAGNQALIEKNQKVMDEVTRLR